MKPLKDLMTVNISISNKTILRIIGVVIAAYLTLQFVGLVSDALILIILAFFFAVALSNPVNWLARHVPGHSRGLATGVAYLIIISILGLILAATLPPVISQTQNFIQDLPEIVSDLETSDSAIAKFARDYDLIDEVRESQEQITSSLSSAGGQILSGVRTVSSSLASTLIILVITFFMLVEAPDWLNRFWALFPKKRRKHYKELADKMHKVVAGYVNGQLFVAFVAAIASLIMMLVIDIPFAIPLAAIVGVFGLIPMIGATLGSIVVILVALTQSLSSAIAMAIFFIVYQQIENNFIQPKIQSKTVDLSPLAVILAALIGVYLNGLLGALLAIPVAGSLKVLFEDYAERKGLFKA